MEEDVVEGDVLDADGLGVGLDLEDAVDEEHGVAVGEDPLDLADVHGGVAVEEGGAVGGFVGVEEFSGEEVVEGVAGLVGDDAAADGTSDKIQVADEVQYFVSGALVDEAEVVFDRAVGADNEEFLGGEVLAQTAGAKLAGFVFEDKRARRRELGNEVVIAEVK